MRILDVCAFYCPEGGGVKTYVQRKMRAAPAAGHEVIILAPGPRDAIVEKRDGAVLATVAAPQLPVDRRYRYFDDERRLHAAIASWNPDVVEASSPWSSASMVARWQGPARRSLVMHADPLAAYAYRWFGSFAKRETIDRRFDWFWQHLRKLDSDFGLTVSASRDLSERLDTGGLRNVVTVPMGVEPGIFSPGFRDEGLRAEMLAQCGLGPDATLLIALGRLAPEKRLPMVIKATEGAAVARPVGLALFGDGRQRERVRRAIGENPHATLFRPIGDRDQLARVLASGDALVHGCEAETFCMVAAEARASGLPLIVPDRGGASDQFTPGRGAKYEAGDLVSLRSAIVDFLHDDPAAHRARARADAAQVRTMDQHFAELFALYGADELRQAA